MRAQLMTSVETRPETTRVSANLRLGLGLGALSGRIAPPEFDWPPLSGSLSRGFAPARRAVDSVTALACGFGGGCVLLMPGAVPPEVKNRQPGLRRADSRVSGPRPLPASRE